MKLVEFKQQTVVYAKDQPPYLPLPAYECKDDEGKIIFCWELTLKERIILLFTGKLWHSVMTFYKPLQPQLMMINKPEELILSEKIKPLINSNIQ